jgi:ABC-type uncharacterized transport system involved in gliding motility auxiliary subunit
MGKLLQKLDTIGLLLLIAAAIYFAVNNVWDKWAIGLALLGGVSVVAGLVANYKQIMQTLGKRSTKYFSNYVVSVVLVLALVAGLNFFGQRHSKRFDLTSIGRFTLAPQTTQILGKLNQDLDIKVFFPGGDYPPMKELLTSYRGVNRHVRFEFIDPDKRPEVAKQFGVTEYRTFQNPFTGSTLKTGTVLISYNGKQEKIEKRDQEIKEEDLTNAIIKVGRKESKTVYFVQGHGEKDLEDNERGGYAGVKKGLEKEGYKVLPLNLAGEAKVPDEAKVLVLAGPKAEPFPKEFEYINNFLNRGGGLLLMVDPSPSASLASFLKEWQVTPDNDIILDVSGAGRLMGAGPSIPIVFKYEPHAITSRFKSQMTFFPMARSFQVPKEASGGVTATTLFKSNDDSWGETDLKNTNAAFDAKTDLKGPLPMALAVDKEIKPAAENTAAVKARMVIVGNSDFAANPYFEMQGNGNLFMNMVSWLAQEEDLISIRPKAPEDRKVVLSQRQQTMLQFLALAFIPGAVLLAGIIVWTRRRR